MSVGEVEPTAVLVPDEIASNVPQKRGRGNPAWVKGGNSPNPSGRPKALQEIQRMLDTQHRSLQNMTEVFQRLRALAMGETILVPYWNEQGEFQLKCELKADARFMQLYLDRLLGPAKAFDEDMDLSDAPAEVIEYLRIKVMKK